MKEEIKKLEVKLSDPNTPQGEVNNLKWELHELKRQQKRKERKDFEKTTKTTVYGSDDYVGCSAGDYSFYYGYEITKCPVKSHKDEDYCYEKDCDKREWCFTVNKGSKEIIRWAESEFSLGEEIERTLILGMAKFINQITNP